MDYDGEFQKLDKRFSSSDAIQGKRNRSGTLQLANDRPEALQQLNLHALTDGRPSTRRLGEFKSLADNRPVQRKENKTGLPDNLKSGVETLSGMSMDHVKVHYNSAQPAQLNAHAYAQGHDIHLAPGQEQHLPHEVWHVVQQAQGRVQPTIQLQAGMPVNDDTGLEHEADVMGARAQAAAGNPDAPEVRTLQRMSSGGVVQRLNYNQLSATQTAQINGVADGIYYQFAPQYEDAIGAAAFVNPNAIEAASHTATNFASILSAYASTRRNQHGESDPAKQDRYLQNTLGSNDREPAGSIGQEAVQIRAALANGNLREHLTLMYNTVQNGVFGKIVGSVLTSVRTQQALARTLGLQGAQQAVRHLTATATHFNVNPAAARDTDYLPRADAAIIRTRGERRQQTRNLPPRFRPDGVGPFGTPMMVEVDYDTFQPIPATRTPMLDNPGGLTPNVVDARVQRPHRADRATQDSARDFSTKGAALSNRELIHQHLSRTPAIRDQQLADQLFAAGVAPDNRIARARIFWRASEGWQQWFLMQRFGNRSLAWEPGKRVFDLVPDAEFTERMDRAKVLLKATGSSSTDLIMKMGRYLYGSNPNQILGMRAAALGWMLPVGDHSYWEILMAAARNGAPGPPPHSPAVYDDHAPMTAQQIGQDNPHLLMQNDFKNVLSHVLFPSNRLQRIAGLAVELPALMPRSHANIRSRVTAVAGNFRATLADNGINAVVSRGAPRVVVEQITDAALLQELLGFVNGLRIRNYPTLAALRAGSATYRRIRAAIGDSNADLIFGAIYKADNTNNDDEAEYLDSVAYFISGDQVNSPGHGLGFSIADLHGASGIVRDAALNYGPHDRGKLLDHQDVTDNLRAEEILALREYTGDAYQDWNALTSEPSSRLGEVGTNLLNRDLDDVQAGISGLQKLPHYNQGRVYRGEGGNIDKYRVGDLVSYQKFLSTSKTYSDSFAPGKNITIVIDDIRTGRDVQLISNQDQEREVLFPPYAKFVVTRVEDRRRAGGQYQGIWVYMNEI
ncbi:eCIS core domain-containing protein [Herbaspirillum rubrisubalbicans]|uniref:eCIS core domain-containing protein n=1 Tax=Herbaspirillum rubrisubalbicans TaxID=80842 RepID=UPI0015EC760E|nr:DUF4157 domain-containing protein [Herbaspirillum rubrisubalbicans]